MILDIFSRYVVGWMVSPAETGELAEAFIVDTLARHGVGRDQLTLHADRGTSMTSKPVAQLLVDGLPQSLAGGEGNAQLIIDGFEGGRLPRRDQIAQIVIEPNSFNATGTGPRITIVSREPGPRGPWSGNASYSYRDSRLNAATPHSIEQTR